MKVRKLTNISEVQISVQLLDGNTIYIPPKGIIENIDIENYYSIQKWSKIELDLSEVGALNEQKSKKKYLKS